MKKIGVLVLLVISLSILSSANISVPEIIEVTEGENFIVELQGYFDNLYLFNLPFSYGSQVSYSGSNMTIECDDFFVYDSGNEILFIRLYNSSGYNINGSLIKLYFSAVSSGENKIYFENYGFFSYQDGSLEEIPVEINNISIKISKTASTSYSGGSSGGGTGFVISGNDVEIEENNVLQLPNNSEEERIEIRNSPITGAVVGAGKNRIVLAIIILSILVFSGILVYLIHKFKYKNI